MKCLLAIRNLVGNNLKTSVLIAVFIVILCTLAYRCSAAEIDLRMGSSFGPGGEGAVLGMEMFFPVGDGVDLYGGTTLWGATQDTGNNWDWHGGFRTCRGPFCACLGASYLKNTDSVDGSHANFNLGLSYTIGWHRVQNLVLTHLSNAGTEMPNRGRNAVLVGFRLQ